MHKKIRLNAAATAGLLIILFFLIIAVFAPVIAPYDPKEMIASYLPPSKEHILGTNDVGQDIFSEMVYGTRVSLYIGIFAAFHRDRCGNGAGAGIRLFRRSGRQDYHGHHKYCHGGAESSSDSSSDCLPESRQMEPDHRDQHHGLDWYGEDPTSPGSCS